MALKERQITVARRWRRSMTLPQSLLHVSWKRSGPLVSRQVIGDKTQCIFQRRVVVLQASPIEELHNE